MAANNLRVLLRMNFERNDASKLTQNHFSDCFQSKGNVEETIFDLFAGM